MHARTRIHTLKEIGEVCGALRARAELEVERANAHLEALGRQRDAQDQALKSNEAGWARAVSGRALQLTASTVWAAEVLRSRAAVAETEKDIRDGQAVRRDLYETLRSASARGDAVGALIGQAVRSQLRRSEEAALENHAGRKNPGWGKP